MEVFIKIEVKDNNVEQALRVLKRKLQRDGFFKIIKLKNTYEKPSEKKKRILQENINWNDKRDNQVKAKYNLMKKMKYKFFHNKGNLKGLPTKLHVNLIMWAYSPYPDILKKNIDLLKLI